jgi:hypothetical protein
MARAKTVTEEGTTAVAEKPARKGRATKAAVSVEPATPRDVREYLLNVQLPEGVTVGARGRLSQAAKDFFTAETGRPIVVPSAE